jgi:hypothetical protein
MNFALLSKDFLRWVTKNCKQYSDTMWVHGEEVIGIDELYIRFRRQYTQT